MSRSSVFVHCKAISVTGCSFYNTIAPDQMKLYGSMPAFLSAMDKECLVEVLEGWYLCTNNTFGNYETVLRLVQ